MSYHHRVIASATLAWVLVILIPYPVVAQQLSSRDTTDVLRATFEQYRPGDGPMTIVSANVQCVDREGWGPLGPVRGKSCRSAATDSAVVPFVRQHNARLYETSSLTSSSEDTGKRSGCLVEINGFGERDGKVLIAITMACPPRSPIVGGFLHQLTYEATRLGSGWRIRQVASLIT